MDGWPSPAMTAGAHQPRSEAFIARRALRVLWMSRSQPLDTAASTGSLMLSVIAAVGQAEREAMLERQREGIAKAKCEGRYKGRVPTARRQTAEITRPTADGVRPSEIAVRGWGRSSQRLSGAGRTERL